LAKQPLKDSRQPASPDHLAGQDGAAPPPREGPSGRGAARDGAAPRASYCAAPWCGGIFSELVDDLAYQRCDNYTCKSCGAPGYWENSAERYRKWDRDTPAGRLYEPDPRFEQLETNRLWDGMGPDLRPVPVGRWISAQEIPASEPMMLVRDPIDGTPIHDLLGQLGFSETPEDIFGADWIAEKAGSTGVRVGRPVRGLRGSHLEEAINQTYIQPNWFTFFRALIERQGGLPIKAGYSLKITRGETRQVNEAAVKKFPNANTRALAELLGITERTVRNLKAVVAANSPKSGEVDAMSATAIDEVRNDVADLREAMHAEFEELFRLLFAFRHGESPVEAWERLREAA
jgi:hypothetical protein